MYRDKRYDVIKLLLKKGQIKVLPDMFEYIPKSVVRHEIKTNNTRFTRLINNPMEFKLTELSTIAKAIGVPTRVLTDIALKDEDKGKRKK